MDAIDNPQCGLGPIIEHVKMWEPDPNDETKCRQQDAEEFLVELIEKHGIQNFDVPQRITYTCQKCKKEDKKVEIENDVTLKIPLVDENKSLQELINNVLSPEIILL